MTSTLAPVRLWGRGTAAALLRYRAIAWLESVALVLLFFVGVPFQVKWINAGIGTLHGILLYPLYLIAVGDLVWRRLRWPWWQILLTAVAGTIPLASLVAERYVSRRIVEPERQAD
jgi:integral membrane protein